MIAAEGHRARLGSWSLLAAVGGLVMVSALALGTGPAHLSLGSVAREVADHLPGVDVVSGLTDRQAAIVWDLRLPRLLLGVVVGAALAGAGAAYQGVFRNPLADPYLLGVAAGAGLGATLIIVAVASPPAALLAGAAFGGGLVAVGVAYALGSLTGPRRTTGALVLAGVAVASFFTAVQTFVQQQDVDSLRRVFSWILGRLGTASWADVRLAFPYVAVALAGLIGFRRILDVLAVGETEASALGLPVARVRIFVVVLATLATAAAVAVSGLIAFVGIVVPHGVRLVVGHSYRAVLPLSIVVGAAFLVGADVVARTVLAPAEVPIGVVTAFVGAPFFGFLLWRVGRS